MIMQRLFTLVWCLAVVAGLVLFVHAGCTPESRVRALNVSADAADVTITMVEAKYLEDQMGCAAAMVPQDCVDGVREQYDPVFVAHRVLVAAWIGLAAATEAADAPTLQAAALELIDSQQKFVEAAERVGVVGKDGGK